MKLLAILMVFASGAFPPQVPSVDDAAQAQIAKARAALETALPDYGAGG